MLREERKEKNRSTERVCVPDGRFGKVEGEGKSIASIARFKLKGK
jgi:hypothetical protein